MGGAEARLADLASDPTTGQLVWFFLNRILDREERRAAVHLRCLTQFDQHLCEICGEPVDIAQEFHDHVSGKVYTPREYVEVQMAMTPEEQEMRQRFMDNLFDQHFAEKARGKTTSEVVPA